LKLIKERWGITPEKILNIPAIIQDIPLMKATLDSITLDYVV
jgi:hypothetical protein